VLSTIRQKENGVAVDRCAAALSGMSAHREAYYDIAKKSKRAPSRTDRRGLS